jgi:hypothetical protein
MKKCKSCQKEIDPKATKCPHCQSDQRNWFMRHKITTVILVLILIGIASSGSSSKTTTSSTQKTQVSGQNAVVEENKPKAWVKVFETNGSSSKQTESFKLQGGKQKITYTLNGGDFIMGSIYVMKEGRSLDKDGGIPEVTVTKSGTDSTMLRKDAGEYYLDVKAANTTWTVTIEEER